MGLISDFMFSRLFIISGFESTSNITKETGI